MEEIITFFPFRPVFTNNFVYDKVYTIFNIFLLGELNLLINKNTKPHRDALLVVILHPQKTYPHYPFGQYLSKYLKEHKN